MKAIIAALPEHLQKEVQGRAMLGNEYTDNPQALIKWTRDNLIEMDRIFREGKKSAEKAAGPKDTPKRSRNRRVNRGSNRQESAKGAKSKLARSRRKEQDVCES